MAELHYLVAGEQRFAACGQPVDGDTVTVTVDSSGRVNGGDSIRALRYDHCTGCYTMLESAGQAWDGERIERLILVRQGARALDRAVTSVEELGELDGVDLEELGQRLRGAVDGLRRVEWHLVKPT